MIEIVENVNRWIREGEKNWVEQNVFKKKESRTAQKIENDKNEIFAPCEHDKRYLFNYYFILKTFIASIMFFKIDEIKKNRRKYLETNQIFF